MARLILDTGVLVAAARGRMEMASVVVVDDDVALPALDRVVGSVPVVEYGTDVAEHHAALLAHVRRAGRPRGAHDLIIAATGRTILTRDARARFDELPDVRARLVSPGGRG